MLTPAEIIAARHNGIHHGTNDSSLPSSAETAETAETVESSATSLSDEAAFPTLGGKTSVSPATPTWGPSMQPPKASEERKRPVAVPKFKTTTIQEAFSLDVQDQLNVAKPEFIKILTAVKSETKTSIECTTSQHIKKRTFLITGKAEDVKLAKRLVIKKLTKPVVVVFTVPAKLRSKIIGPQGKTLKPIVAQNEVRIDIGTEEETEENDGETDNDDVFGTSIKVTVEGDVEGCKHARAQIMAIVKAETKNMSAKVEVGDNVRHLASQVVSDIVARYPDLDVSVPDHHQTSGKIVLVGPREDVLAAREEVKAALEAAERRVVCVSVPIPLLKHQFLPVEQILAAHQVLIRVREGETNVEFVGEKSNVEHAKEDARKHTSQYKVEVLDMSKAHRGNLPHVRAVAQYLAQSRFFEKLAQEHGVVVNAPRVDPSSTAIPIEIVSKGDEAEQVKAVKKAIVTEVNRITPADTQVISDVDEFFIKDVPRVIRDVAAAHKVAFVVVGSTITLFDDGSADDFVDNTEGFAAVNAALDPLREKAKLLTKVELPKEAAKYVKEAIKHTFESSSPISVQVDNDKVVLYGIGSDVELVKAEVEQVLADVAAHGDTYKESVVVPVSVLSRLIGKGGASMNALRQEFGVKVDVGEEKDGRASVDIVGIKRNVEHARAHVAQLSKRWADETLLRVPIDNQYHRRMIGAGGMYINRLQDKYNVKIRFPAADGSNVGAYSDSPSNRDEVTIKGPSKGAARAQEELRDLLKYEMENGFKQTLQVPVKAIARVIGKSGETIRDIADGCGVEYTFRKDKDTEKETGYTEVELTGSKAALKEAAAKINSIIAEVENHVVVSVTVPTKYHRELIGTGGKNMREIIARAGGSALPRHKQHRLLSIPNEGSGSEEVVCEGDRTIVNKIVAHINEFVSRKAATVEDEIDLPKEKHRLIIGPAGSIRHALQDEFDAVIDIPRPADKSTLVRVAALPEKLEALKAKIADMTKDDWKTSLDVPEHLHALVSERGAIFNKLSADLAVDVVHGNLTRRASKLSAAPIPSPPSSAIPEDGRSSLFTIVPRDPVTESQETIPWRFKGDKADKAAALVAKRLENARNATAHGWFYAREPAVFSKIIGNRGSKVNQIREKTGAFITVPRADDKNANLVFLVGTEDSLKKAGEEIKRVCEERRKDEE